MAAEWYCSVSGKTLGPLSAEQLKALAEQGKLTPRHQVRRGTDDPWVSAGRVKGLFPKASDATPVARARSTEAQAPQTQVPQARAAVTPPDPQKAKASGATAPPNPLGIIVDNDSPTARLTRRRKSGTTSPAGRKKHNTRLIVASAAGIAVLSIVAISLALSGSSEKAPNKEATPKPAVEESPSLEDIEARLEADEASATDAAEPLGTDVAEPSNCEGKADDQSNGHEGGFYQFK